MYPGMTSTRPRHNKAVVCTKVWAAACVFLILGLTFGNSTRAAEPAWFDADNRPITYAAVVGAVRAADVAVLGEIHDNPRHHRLQAGLLRDMIAAGKRPAVVWEMIDRNQQSAIDGFLASGSANADAFAAAVNWAESGWPDWAIYRPIAEVALAAGLPMIAGDLDRAAMMTVMSSGVGGALPDAPDLWPVDEVYDEDAEAAQLDAIFHGHCELVPRDQLRPMLAAQYARDMSLALAVLNAVDAHGTAVLIAGNGHARRDIAVPMLIEHARPGLDVVTVGLREAKPAEPDDDVTIPFDVVGETEAIERPDPCEALRKKFSKSN